MLIIIFKILVLKFNSTLQNCDSLAIIYQPFNPSDFIMGLCNGYHALVRSGLLYGPSVFSLSAIPEQINSVPGRQSCRLLHMTTIISLLHVLAMPGRLQCLHHWGMIDPRTFYEMQHQTVCECVPLRSYSHTRPCHVQIYQRCQRIGGCRPTSVCKGFNNRIVPYCHIVICHLTYSVFGLLYYV